MALVKTLLRWLSLVVVGVATILVLTVALVAIIGPRIDVSILRPRIEVIAGQALDRSVELEGMLAVVLSLPPVVEATQIRIGNPPNWPNPDFVRIEQISARVNLTPLLHKQIVIDEIRTTGGAIFLQASSDGMNNWTLPADQSQTDGGDWRLVAVNDISLSNITFQYKDQSLQHVDVRIDKLTAELPAGDPILVNAMGTAQSFPFSIEAKAGSLSELLVPRGPWPIKANLALNHNQLQVNGSLTEPLELQKVSASVEFEGTRVADLAALVDAPSPEIGEYRIEAEISGDPDSLTLSGISGHIGKTVFSGDLTLAGPDDQSRIAGSVFVEALDVGPWLETSEPQKDVPPDSRPTASSNSLPEVDLRLQVKEFLNLPVEIADVSLAARLEGNALNAPFQATAAGLSIKGQLGIKQENSVYDARIEMQTEQADVGDLINRYTDLAGIAGSVGLLSIQASTQGDGPESFVKNLGMSVRVQDAAMSYGNKPGETPIRIDLDELTFSGTARQRAQSSVRGRLLGEPFSVELRLGDLSAIVEEQSLPFDLRVTGAGAELSAEGRLAGEKSQDHTALKLHVSGKRFGELAPWLGVSPDVKLPYKLSGQLWMKNDLDAWQLRDLHAQLGRSAIGGAIGRSRLKSEPLLRASLAFDVIDLFELERAFSGGRPREPQKSGKGIDMEMPILPKELNLKDMDIDIKAQRVVLIPSDITDIAFSARIRDGYVSGAPFRGTLAGTRLTGNIAMDLRGEVPEIKYDLEANDVDVGGFLRELKLATEIDAHAERLTAKVVSHGSSMGELFNDSEINIEAHSGHWLLADPNKAGSAQIEVIHGTARAVTKTRRTVVKLDARIGEDKVPMDFTLETRRLTPKSGNKEFLDTKIQALAAGAELTMQGLLPRLSGLRGLDVHLSFRGDRIDTLDQLLKVSLPPFGPYSIDGQLKIEDTGYSLSNIDIRVGGTSAKGNVSVSTAGEKPQLTSKLEAETFQLDDFRLRDWSPATGAKKEIEVIKTLDRNVDDELSPTESEGKIEESATTRQAQQEDRQQAQAESAQPLLSREVMHSFNAKAEFRVGQVLSGHDQLGSGEMTITLQDGQLSLPLNIDVPGGELALELTLQATDRDYTATLHSIVENFDYGVFARRIRPETDMAGMFSLDIDLTSQGETFGLFDDNANGHFDFVIWPETLRSDIFDLWTANLFFAVLSRINPESRSKVNCLVGRFNMKDGVMKPDPLFMDTTHTQIRAKGEINFRTERIKLRLTPRSKRPKFFSLSTPVVVEGKFSDFGVNLKPHDVVGTALGMVYTLAIVPVQYVFRGVRPSVDIEECKKALGKRAGKPEP